MSSQGLSKLLPPRAGPRDDVRGKSGGFERKASEKRCRETLTRGRGIETMKSKLLRVTVFATGAIALSAVVSPALAKTYAYTFGTPSSEPYCDGLTISGGDGGWSGNHTGSCTDNDPAGGFTVKIGGAKYIDISTTDNASDPGVAETFLLQPKTGAWYLYINQGLGSGFEFINEGQLIKGAPPSVRAPGAKPSNFKNPKAVDKPIF